MWIILTGDSDNDCDFCNYVFVSEDCRTGCGPLLARVATRMITFLVYRGFQPKPSFATIASWGPQPTHYQSRTVDGRNLANQLTGSSSRSLQGFLSPRWLFWISSINSISPEPITVIESAFRVFDRKSLFKNIRPRQWILRCERCCLG